jgi:hypothetical protein
MYSLAITLSVRSGPVEIWASLADTGYFDPTRYPERLVASLQSGQATTVVVSVPSVEAALVLRPSHHTWPVAFLMTVVMGEHSLLSVETISYRDNAEQSIAEHTRTRLGSVTSIARVGAHKITPGKFSPDQRVLEFSPSLPANAVVQ